MVIVEYLCTGHMCTDEVCFALKKKKIHKGIQLVEARLQLRICLSSTDGELGRDVGKRKKLTGVITGIEVPQGAAGRTRLSTRARR